MSDLLLLDGASVAAPGWSARKGLVRAQNKVVLDDDGVFHPLGLTFFWALYGWRYERDRILEHLKWLAPKGFDYVRILGEVDWQGRSIDPSWGPEVIAEFVDAAYDHGLRTEVSIVGGRQYDENTGARRFVPQTYALRIAQALVAREHKVMHYECANEWARLDKVDMEDLIEMGSVLSQFPHLVALSDPAGEREHAAAMDHEGGPEASAEQMAEVKAEAISGYEQMINATKAAGCSAYTRHPRRSSHDNHWSHVRQGYDFKDFPGVVWNNEPEGPGSSVVSMTSPLQLACCRLLGIMCGGAGYVLHVGQGVLGIASPQYGRPANMWEVPNIDVIMKVVRDADALMPLGVENWQCVNNGRSNHPLPLDGHTGFWEGGAGDRAPAVNKNYAAISNTAFVVMLTGVKSNGITGPVPAGTARRHCHVEAIDPVTHAVVFEGTLEPGQSFTVPGRGDTMAAYVVRGRYL